MAVRAATGDGTPGATAEAGKGGYVPDVIVLMTDGANNRGITPFQAVPYAVARRVRDLHDRLRNYASGSA